ncbi:MAG: methionine adenosyltransferase [Candidatus Kerfeldbacteria bacterium]
MIRYGLFTSESVTEGHPDKACDKVSDAILDACLALDPLSRVACETGLKATPDDGSLVCILAEITTNADFDLTDVVRQQLIEIGYRDPETEFDVTNFELVRRQMRQSNDIAMGVNEGDGLHDEQGAGDQGMMFGFACDETPELMPLTIHLAHRLCERLTHCRREEILPWLRADGKSQVTVRYENGKPVAVDTVVVSAQHAPDVRRMDLEDGITLEVIREVLGSWFTPETKLHINPTGAFTIGGPAGDAGVTGRKIIVDTYGGHGAHGGGCFSGKDPTKVDRSAAYMGRYIAKNLVAAGIARQALVQLAYAIGVADPVSCYVDTCGTAGDLDDRDIAAAVMEIFPLTPAGIIRHLSLCRPVYRPTAAYGHFGRTGDAFTWEQTNMVDALRSHFNL